MDELMLPAAQRHVRRMERTRQVGHFFVALAEGNPEMAAALVAVP